MPYISEAERKRALWMTIGEAVVHVMEHMDCSKNTALQQIRIFLNDHPLAAWDGPDLPDLFADGRVMFLGELAPAVFDRQPFWPTARIRDDKVFDPHRKCWRVVLVPRISILHAWPRKSSKDKAPSKQKQNVPRRDYRNADARLFPRIDAMLASGEADTATDAARAIVDEIPGHGCPTNKVRRLVRHYRAATAHA